MMTDEELMIACADGADDAFGELFRRYTPILLRLVQRHVGRPADAQDIVQQTFLQLHRARRDFRRDTRFRPWIMTIALNLSRDLLRRRGRRRETAVDEAALPVPDTTPVDGGEAARRVRSALSELPREQREVIELHWFEQLSFAESAGIVGATSGAVRVRAHRGYVTLRKSLDPGGGRPQEA